MLFISSTQLLIRHLWQLMTVVLLHWCLIRDALLAIAKWYSTHLIIKRFRVRIPTAQLTLGEWKWKKVTISSLPTEIAKWKNTRLIIPRSRVRAMSLLQAPEAVLLVECDPSMNELWCDMDRSMHRSLWAYVTHSSFIEGSHMTKNTASGGRGWQKVIISSWPAAVTQF